jgi:hypothetical protein
VNEGDSVIVTRHFLAARLLGLGLLSLGLVFAGPVRAQSLDDLLVSGVLPDDARSAPGQLSLGIVLDSALSQVGAETLRDNREHGFCVARNDDHLDIFSYSRGSQMEISLRCAGHANAAGEMHTHPSFSAGIPSTEDFGGLNPSQTAFVVTHPGDGEATIILLTRQALAAHTLSSTENIAAASAVIRIMALEFMQSARPAEPDQQHDSDFADLYVSAVCQKLALVCYHRAHSGLAFARVGEINDVISVKYSPDEQRRGLMGVQLLLDWLGGEDFHLPGGARPVFVTSMAEGLGELDELGPKWWGAVIFTSPHIITNVRFPSDAGHDFVGLAIPSASDQKIIETGGAGLRTFSATEDAYDPRAPISSCIREGEDVTIKGRRYNDALFGDISSGRFQHHCFSLRQGSALQLTATEIVSDGYMTTTVENGGRKSVSRTALADFCPPDNARQAIMFCSRRPSFTVP